MNISSLFTNMLDDNVIKALIPKVKEAIDPIFIEVRSSLLTHISGPPPDKFREKVSQMYAFSDVQVKALWEAACESAL
jgi:hypothetical protein